jgi:hypothetical protein
MVMPNRDAKSDGAAGADAGGRPEAERRGSACGGNS